MVRGRVAGAFLVLLVLLLRCNLALGLNCDVSPSLAPANSVTPREFSVALQADYNGSEVCPNLVVTSESGGLIFNATQFNTTVASFSLVNLRPGLYTVCCSSSCVPVSSNVNSSVSSAPTSVPTEAPTVAPSASAAPTSNPTFSPTTSGHTASPTGSPTVSPTASPVTSSPTGSPTNAPSESPTQSPGSNATSAPTASSLFGDHSCTMFVSDPATVTITLQGNLTELSAEDQSKMIADIQISLARLLVVDTEAILEVTLSSGSIVATVKLLATQSNTTADMQSLLRAAAADGLLADTLALRLALYPVSAVNVSGTEIAIVDLAQNHSAPFKCSYITWNVLLTTVTPLDWGTLLGRAGLPPWKVAPSTCRHCWWDLGYPFANPLVYVLGLNCRDFVNDYENKPALNISDFKDLFMGSRGGRQRFPNPSLVETGFLDPDAAVRLVNFNRDDEVSLDEYMVAAHFWAPMIWSQAGPAPHASTRTIMGGFFFDLPAWGVWLDQSFNLGTLADQYRGSQWQLRLRNPRSSETANAFRRRDLDHSGKFSLEEHYFKLWADLDRDGCVTEEEFDSSLYKSNQSSFASHDINGNGVITFLERKIFAADTDASGTLTFDEWVAGDFDRVEFLNHDLDGAYSVQNNVPQVLNRSELIRYHDFFECSFHERGRDQDLWDGQYSSCRPTPCHIEVGLLLHSPYVIASSNSSRRTGETGFSAELFDLISRSFSWNIAERQVFSTTEETTQWLRNKTTSSETAKNFRNFPMAIVSSADPQWDSEEFECSESISPNDGLSILVLKHPSPVQLEVAFLLILVSPAFLQFMCICFFSTLVMGHIFYFVENGSNSDFNSSYVKGILDGLYFSTVTLTSVGYGDKRSTTASGRVFAILWMLLGVILFSIFAGEATSQIGQLRLENSIGDGDDLAGMTIGVLQESVGGPSISHLKGFKEKIFPNMKEAAAALKDEDVPGIVAPYAEVISFLEEESLLQNPCDNDFKFAGGVGSLGTTGSLVTSNKICASIHAGHAAVHIIRILEARLEELQKQAAYNALVNKYFALVGSSSSDCPEPTGFPMILLIATACILVFLGTLAFVFRHRRLKKLEAEKKAHTALVIGSAAGDKAARVARYAKHWLKMTREGAPRREIMSKVDEIRERLLQAGALDAHSEQGYLELNQNLATGAIPHDVQHVSSGPLQGNDRIFSLLQGSRTSILQMRENVKVLGNEALALHREALEGRKQLSRIVTFFAAVNFVNILLVILCCAILVIVWGTQRDETVQRS